MKKTPVKNKYKIFYLGIQFYLLLFFSVIYKFIVLIITFIFPWQLTTVPEFIY